VLRQRFYLSSPVVADHRRIRRTASPSRRT
jgi:hypothetical protein